MTPCGQLRQHRAQREQVAMPRRAACEKGCHSKSLYHEADNRASRTRLLRNRISGGSSTRYALTTPLRTRTTRGKPRAASRSSFGPRRRAVSDQRCWW